MIHSINEAAFGGQEEADLVDKLRAKGLVLASLVAEMSGGIVGHILFSRILIETADGSSTWALAGWTVATRRHPREHTGIPMSSLFNLMFDLRDL